MARTHGLSCYQGGCRCNAGRAAEALRRRNARARRSKAPCEVCNRVHSGRCQPDDARTRRFSVTLPGRVARRLAERVPWGDRSRWVAALIEAELDRVDAEAAA